MLRTKNHDELHFIVEMVNFNVLIFYFRTSSGYKKSLDFMISKFMNFAKHCLTLKLCLSIGLVRNRYFEIAAATSYNFGVYSVRNINLSTLYPRLRPTFN